MQEITELFVGPKPRLFRLVGDVTGEYHHETETFEYCSGYSGYIKAFGDPYGRGTSTLLKHIPDVATIASKGGLETHPAIEFLDKSGPVTVVMTRGGGSGWELMSYGTAFIVENEEVARRMEKYYDKTVFADETLFIVYPGEVNLSLKELMSRVDKFAAEHNREEEDDEN
jgi:hypothetical protein